MPEMPDLNESWCPEPGPQKENARTARFGQDFGAQSPNHHHHHDRPSPIAGTEASIGPYSIIHLLIKKEPDSSGKSLHPPSWWHQPPQRPDTSWE